ATERAERIWYPTLMTGAWWALVASVLCASCGGRVIESIPDGARGGASSGSGGRSESVGSSTLPSPPSTPPKRPAPPPSPPREQGTGGVAASFGGSAGAGGLFETGGVGGAGGLFGTGGVRGAGGSLDAAGAPAVLDAGVFPDATTPPFDAAAVVVTT